MGEVSIVDINEKKPWSRNQMCSEIVAIQNDLYSQRVIQTEHNLITSQVNRHKDESLHVEADDFRLNIAERDYVPSFFSHSLCIGRLMLLVNGSTVYLRDLKTSEWIESIALDSLVVNLY